MHTNEVYSPVIVVFCPECMAGMYFDLYQSNASNEKGMYQDQGKASLGSNMNWQTEI